MDKIFFSDLLWLQNNAYEIAKLMYENLKFFTSNMNFVHCRESLYEPDVAKLFSSLPYHARLNYILHYTFDNLRHVMDQSINPPWRMEPHPSYTLRIFYWINMWEKDPDNPNRYIFTGFPSPDDMMAKVTIRNIHEGSDYLEPAYIFTYEMDDNLVLSGFHTRIYPEEVPTFAIPKDSIICKIPDYNTAGFSFTIPPKSEPKMKYQ